MSNSEKRIERLKAAEAKSIPLEEIKKLRNRKEKMYIYGTGMYGRDICKMLKSHGIRVDGFIVSQKRELETLFDLPIVAAQDILSSGKQEYPCFHAASCGMKGLADIGIVVGVKPHNAIDVKNLLESYHFDMNDMVYEYDFEPIQKHELPRCLDINTKVGCTINCRFCPQDNLLKNYFREQANRDKLMSIDTFSRCIEKVPPEYAIGLSSFVEPFLNPNCMEMIKIAHNMGKKIRLYTTLVGTDRKIVDQLCEMPFELFVLHVADQQGYAKIPLTEEYYKSLEQIVNAKRKDGTPLVDVCNAQTEPDPRVMEICQGKIEIATTMCDRAGQLEHDELYKHLAPSGAITCNDFGQSPSHSVLPDGTVVLCCVDFGLKHVLGNLLEESFEEIINGSEMSRVRKGMLEDDTIDILCRKCSSACPVRK